MYREGLRIQVIQAQLEKEITILNKTRAASLEATDGSTGGRQILG